MNIQKAEGYRKNIIELLKTEDLPTADLPESLENFRVVLQYCEVIAVAGFEVYGSFGLLRSLVVHKDYRGLGIADKLLHRIEVLAGVKELLLMYLLTETAPDYFGRKGYETITRRDVPPEVQQSSQFSYACPQSAIVMKKIIKPL